MDLTNTPSWPTCAAAKVAWVAEVAISGKNSSASAKLQDIYILATKTCAEETGITVPW